MSDPVRIGVVGLGYWGPNLARNFSQLPEADLVWCCDADEERRERVAAQFPKARLTARYEDLLEDEQLDAVVVATPVPTHHALAREALLAGKHVFVEKPLAWTAADARDLDALSNETGRTLMVGHLLRFHPGVVKLRHLIDSGELGDVLYVYGNRQNLGVIREDENALWSLGVHDISVVLYLLGGRPVEVSARGESYVRPGVEDVVFGYLKLATGQVGHLHMSWLDPHKMRKMTVVGSKRMAVFDDMEAERKVTVYDKGPMEIAPGKITTHTGDITIPAISREEPLRIECRAFIDAVREGGHDHPANGAEGVAVVEVLQGMQRSLEEGGATVALEAAPA
ncbi:MAG TPA: Gfo/Idh/MocA family oxidoreductase [Gaiellales bacterium]|nr:Gfo/Idh/MocA family oxidoreductase [Gaiellales bacterium]